MLIFSGRILGLGHFPKGWEPHYLPHSLRELMLLCGKQLLVGTVLFWAGGVFPLGRISGSTVMSPPAVLVTGGIQLAGAGEASLPVGRCDWWGMNEGVGTPWRESCGRASVTQKNSGQFFFSLCPKKLYLKRVHVGAQGKIYFPFEKVLLF